MSMNVGTGVGSYNKAVNTTSASLEVKKDAITRSEEKKIEEKVDTAVVYEASDAKPKTVTYSINKMSAEERASLVERLKSEQEDRQKQLLNIVQKMMSKQATVYGQADDDVWKFLASGEYTVDAETQAQAKADIAEDGYYGIKQTSQRLFDFASALAGDDVETMKEMQAAVVKGFEMATKAWGKELPEICHDTLAATNQLFEDYYTSIASS